MKLTDEQIQESGPMSCETCANCGTSAADEPCRGCSMVKPLLWRPKLVEPETPDRKGQLFVDPRWPQRPFGPITESTNDEHLGYDAWTGKDSILHEAAIKAGTFVRIPPKLPGMDAGECRKPKNGEDFYDLCGVLINGAAVDVVVRVPNYDDRRWIKNKPAEPKPWPVGPFTVERSRIPNDNGQPYRVVDGTHTAIANCGWPERAEAIALALNLLPEFVALLHEATETLDVSVAAESLLAKVAGYEFRTARGRQ